MNGVIISVSSIQLIVSSSQLYAFPSVGIDTGATQIHEYYLTTDIRYTQFPFNPNEVSVVDIVECS